MRCRSGFLGAALNPVGLLARTASPGDIDVYAGDFNRDDVRRVEIPAGNGTRTARAVAQFVRRGGLRR